jgi:hypothetical protein
MLCRHATASLLQALPLSRGGVCLALVGAALALLPSPAAEAASVRVKTPRPGATVRGPIPFAVAAAGRPRSVTFYVDGRRRWKDGKAPFRLRRWQRRKLAQLSAGPHRLSALVRYRHRRSRRISIVVRVAPRAAAATDRTAPRVSWKAPLTGQTVRGVLADARCEVAASDDRGIKDIRFYVDGRHFDTEGRAPYNCRLDTATLTTGSHTIRAVAADAAGNRTAASVTVNVDNRTTTSTTAPTSPITTSTDAFRPLWNGNFETGDITQWGGVQRVATDRVTVTGSHRVEGSYAARFEVRPGDNIGDTAPRAELVKSTYEPEGSERWYRWWTYWSADFPTNYPNSFITFTQWRALDESRTYGNFMQWGDRIELRRGGTHWSTPLVKGVWHKFVYHVKWSPDPAVGFIELYYDGKLVLPKKHMATMAGTPGNGVVNYLKQGLYKSDEIPTGVLYHDGMAMGDSLAAVGGP